jgi:hypothetical protein
MVTVNGDWNFVKRFPFVSVLTAIRQRHVVRIALLTYLLVTYIRFPLIWLIIETRLEQLLLHSSTEFTQPLLIG